MSGNGKGAVAETLWLLETVSTAFRGTVTRTGTIEGKYFNQIIKDSELLTQEVPLKESWNGRRPYMAFSHHPLEEASDTVWI